MPKTKLFDNEEIKIINGVEYRYLNPFHSKFGAALAKGVQQTGLKENSIVLYLGASHGFTPSFFSDFLTKGFLIALDFAPRVVRDLWLVCEKRKNMAPLLADANNPLSYKELIPEVDVIFQDIAQKNQLEIFLKNSDLFLKKGGYGLLALKARSIDVTKKPFLIFKEIRKKLDSLNNYVLVDYRELSPFEKDHAFFVIKKKINK